MYGKKNISSFDDKTIKEIIGKDHNPLFRLVKRNNDSLINKNDLGFFKNIKDSNSFKCKLVIENFPSRIEFHSLFENFIRDTKANVSEKEINREHKQNHIEAQFNTESVALEFLKYINMQRVSNQLYSKIKANLCFDIASVKESSKLPPVTRRALRKNHSQIAKDHSADLRMNNSIVDKETINSSYENGKVKIKRDMYNKVIKDEEFLQKYYGHSNFIRISNPYMSDEEKRIEADKVNREKWIANKDFKRFAKFRPNLMSNYVNLGKYIPPHEFREVNKDKWVGKKNFYVV